MKREGKENVQKYREGKLQKDRKEKAERKGRNRVAHHFAEIANVGSCVEMKK